MYFSHFPLLVYDAAGTDDYKLVTNLIKRVAMHAKAKSVASIFDTYDVRSGETPEMVSYEYYGDPEYHWIILLVNNITDRYHQWPMNNRQFHSHVSTRYDNVDATHHYEIYQVSGDTTVKINIGPSNVDTDGETIADAVLVTNREYEEAKQDELRKIRLLDPTYVEQFVEDFENLIGS